MKKKTILGIVVLFLLTIGFLSFQVFQSVNFLSSLDECGMSTGPIYGDSISIDIENLKFDQQIDIPHARLGLLNLSDTLAPKLIKLNKAKDVIWAVEFREDSILGLPHQRLSEMKLIEDEFGIRLSFFNDSYGEPGNIYLTDDYNVKYMCLSPM